MFIRPTLPTVVGLTFSAEMAVQDFAISFILVDVLVDSLWVYFNVIVAFKPC
jgi:hypothetical protein